MGKTRIEWATDSWPVITGCSPVSEGCRNCYAARLAATRLKHHPHYSGLATMVNGHPQWTGEVRFNSGVLEQPLRWRKPRVVFPCSMSDLFHEDVDWQWLDKIFAAMVLSPRHIFLILTKRPQRMREYLTADRGGFRNTADRVDEACGDEFNYYMDDDPGAYFTEIWPPQNVWPGVTVETQEQMWRLEELVKIPAARLWASLEPLLGPIVIPPELLAKLSGLVVGGESGPGARIMDPDWARSIRDQCISTGLPYTFKQHGEYWTGEKGRIYESNRYEMWSDGRQIIRCGKKAAGRELDGKVWDEFPWKLMDKNAELVLGGPRKEG